jgi:hypothetical protein
MSQLAALAVDQEVLISLPAKGDDPARTRRGHVVEQRIRKMLRYLVRYKNDQGGTVNAVVDAAQVTPVVPILPMDIHIWPEPGALYSHPPTGWLWVGPEPQPTEPEPTEPTEPDDPAPQEPKDQG